MIGKMEQNVILWLGIGIIVYIIVSYIIGGWEEALNREIKSGSLDFGEIASWRVQQFIIFVLKLLPIAVPILGFYYSSLEDKKMKYRISAEKAYAEIPLHEIISNNLPSVAEVSARGGFKAKMYLPNYKAMLIVPSEEGEKKVILDVSSNCRNESRLLEVIDGETRWDDYKWGRKYKTLQPLLFLDSQRYKKPVKKINVAEQLLGGE